MAGRVWKEDALRTGRRAHRVAVRRLALLTAVALATLLAWASVAGAAGSSGIPDGAVAPDGVRTHAPLSPWLATARAVAVHGVPSTQTLFSDDFESGLSKWQLQGNPGWAATTYRAAAGTSSAYCAGSAISPPGPYANNMNAWMIAGPFDLSKATAATLSLKIFSLTEIDKDFLSAFVSINNVDYWGYKYSGNYNAWTDKSIDLTAVPTLGNLCGKSQVWIAIVFKSDPAVVYEGSYVDKVTLTATVPSTGQRETGLVLTADAETVPYNGSADLVGALLDATSGSLIPGKSVGLFWSQENKIDGEWNYAGSADSATGDYSVSASGIKRLTYFALVFDGDNEYLSTMSNLVRVNARARLTPPAVPKVVSSGPKITSWGTIQPPHTAAQNRSSHTKVYLERYYGGKWRAVVSLYAQQYKNTQTETLYAIALRYKPGSWRVKAVHQDDDHAKTVSSWRTFTVR
jgi:hypothetical protein